MSKLLPLLAEGRVRERRLQTMLRTPDKSDNTVPTATTSDTPSNISSTPQGTSTAETVDSRFSTGQPDNNNNNTSNNNGNDNNNSNNSNKNGNNNEETSKETLSPQQRSQQRFATQLRQLIHNASTSAAIPPGKVAPLLAQLLELATTYVEEAALLKPHPPKKQHTVDIKVAATEFVRSLDGIAQRYVAPLLLVRERLLFHNVWDTEASITSGEHEGVTVKRKDIDTTDTGEEVTVLETPQSHQQTLLRAKTNAARPVVTIMTSRGEIPMPSAAIPYIAAIDTLADRLALERRRFDGVSMLITHHKHPVAATSTKSQKYYEKRTTNSSPPSTTINNIKTTKTNNDNNYNKNNSTKELYDTLTSTEQHDTVLSSGATTPPAALAADVKRAQRLLHRCSTNNSQKRQRPRLRDVIALTDEVTGVSPQLSVVGPKSVQEGLCSPDALYSTAKGFHNHLFTRAFFKGRPVVDSTRHTSPHRAQSVTDTNTVLHLSRDMGLLGRQENQKQEAHCERHGLSSTGNTSPNQYVKLANIAPDHTGGVNLEDVEILRTRRRFPTEKIDAVLRTVAKEVKKYIQENNAPVPEPYPNAASALRATSNNVPSLEE